ncbi:response regulator [Oligoflexia bacterium]|nr:response regulator [Oligoflexia bacterium]
MTSETVKIVHNLLIVEDNDAQRRTLTAIMQQEGFTPLPCATAKEALEQVRKVEVNVAILDLRLPDIEGTHLLEKLKAHHPNLLAIINTGFGSFNSAMDAVNIGAFAYVEKAGDPDEIMRHVNRAFQTYYHKHVEDLEAVVAERTQALNQMNQELRQEIKEHKQEQERRVALEGQLRQAQKMEALGTLAGGIAHDFNNLLAGIVLAVELTQREVPTASPSSKRLDLALRTTERMKALVEQILVFSQAHAEERNAVKIDHIVKEAVTLLRAALPTTIAVKHEINLTRGTISVSEHQIVQALLNLGTNAAQAIGTKQGTISICVDEIEVSNNLAHALQLEEGQSYVRIVVADNGCGMGADAQARIFDPFFTTKAPGEGTGLGLSVVHGILKNHQGAISVTSSPGQGTTFECFLPLVDAVIREAHDNSELIHKECGHVLFVDDEEVLAKLGSEQLQRLGYSVVSLSSSAKALEIFKADPTAFDLIITDQTMPYKTGLELIKEAKSLRPNIAVVLMSGLGRVVSEEVMAEVGIDVILPKPYMAEELRQAAKKALAR